VTLVTASMADKDVGGVVRALAAATSLRGARVVATRVDLSRSLPAAELAAIWRSVGGDVTRKITIEPDPQAALDRALAGPPGPIVVAGSLYLVGAIRARLVDDPLLRDPVDNRP
jgi:folylpolyglutamate synthase/dihydropteroate synthase